MLFEQKKQNPTVDQILATSVTKKQKGKIFEEEKT